MSEAMCWPEQEAIEQWKKDFGVELTFEQEDALKMAASAYRLEVQKRMEPDIGGAEPQTSSQYALGYKAGQRVWRDLTDDDYAWLLKICRIYDFQVRAVIAKFKEKQL